MSFFLMNEPNQKAASICQKTHIVSIPFFRDEVPRRHRLLGLILFRGFSLTLVMLDISNRSKTG